VYAFGVNNPIDANLPRTYLAINSHTLAVHFLYKSNDKHQTRFILNSSSLKKEYCYLTNKMIKESPGIKVN